MSLPAGSDCVPRRSSPQDGAGCARVPGAVRAQDRGDRPPRCACRLERRLERRASSAGISIRLGLATCMRSERQQTANYANFPWGRGRYNMQCSRAGGRAEASVFDISILIFGGCDSSMLIYTIEIRYFRTCSTAAPGRHHAHRTGHRRAESVPTLAVSSARPAYVGVSCGVCPFRLGRRCGARCGVTVSEARSRIAPLARSACSRGSARRTNVTGGTPSQSGLLG